MAGKTQHRHEHPLAMGAIEINSRREHAGCVGDFSVPVSIAIIAVVISVRLEIPVMRWDTRVAPRGAAS
jgi:hypothetical protein